MDQVVAQALTLFSKIAQAKLKTRSISNTTIYANENGSASRTKIQRGQGQILTSK
jgi:hypothetical protein